MKKSNTIGGALLGVFLAATTFAAEIAVDGLGWWRNREMRNSLNRLLEAESRPVLDANAIEDGAVILRSSLGEQGYQEPAISIVLRSADGGERKAMFDPTFANPLPRPLAAEAVAYEVSPGRRAFIDSVEITGLTAISHERATSFFRNDSTLFGTERANAFAPGKVNRGADALQAQLRQLGLAEAVVRASKIGDATEGPLAIAVKVVEGPRWEVTDVVLHAGVADDVELPDPHDWVGRPWTPTLEQEVREALRRAYYEAGYPDVRVAVDAEVSHESEGWKASQLVARMEPGARVSLGDVRFVGNATTRDSVLRRRVRLDTGDPLNPLALERARYRISRLGVFESVDLTYEPPDATTRDAVFTVREAPRHEMNLLFGYGSYEQLRGGIEYRQRNIRGMAHQSRLELIQSMKSTSADYTYTVPELFGETLDGTARLFGLQRDEVAFIRQEYGATFSVRRPVRWISGEIGAGYTFEALRNRRSSLSTEVTDERQVNVASVTLAASGDTRDNPLVPRHGYHWSAQSEAADPVLGGESTYQRVELATGYHTSWGTGRWIHAGLSHGFITTLGGVSDASLPVNKRFFPGGDNSIRGYQRGEAAPRGPDGRFIGAKTYLLLNVELEQAIAPQWSVVVFADALGSSSTLGRYPFEEDLYAAGLGLRFNTLIGPIRLEYGRNLNPRVDDPSGTWHLSIGFPF